MKQDAARAPCVQELSGHQNVRSPKCQDFGEWVEHFLRFWNLRPPSHWLTSCSGPAEHKVEKQCDGKRKRTAYVSLPDFTERQLVQDYRLLEETQRVQVGLSAGLGQCAVCSGKALGVLLRILRYALCPLMKVAPVSNKPP